MGAGRAAWSVVLGVLAIVILPAAIIGTRYSESYDLLHAGFAIPVAAAAGIAAIAVARRARARDRATLDGTGGARSATWGRILGIVGICFAASATISVTVYGLLIAVD